MDHEDLVFTAELSQVNNDVASYLKRVLGLDPSVIEYAVPIEEVKRSLGSRLVEIGQKMQARGQQRAVIVEGEVEASPQALP